MLSNVASASRAILSKGLMNKPIGENLDAPNLCVYHLRLRSHGMSRFRAASHPPLTTPPLRPTPLSLTHPVTRC